jgi:hypothetical protein
MAVVAALVAMALLGLTLAAPTADLVTEVPVRHSPTLCTPGQAAHSPSTLCDMFRNVWWRAECTHSLTLPPSLTHSMCHCKQCHEARARMIAHNRISSSLCFRAIRVQGFSPPYPFKVSRTTPLLAHAQMHHHDHIRTLCCKRGRHVVETCARSLTPSATRAVQHGHEEMSSMIDILLRCPLHKILSRLRLF